APPSTRAITRMRMSAEYAFGMVRPPDESMPPDSPIYRSLGILRFYSARTRSRCGDVPCADLRGAADRYARRNVALRHQPTDCGTIARKADGPACRRGANIVHLSWRRPLHATRSSA